MKHNREQQEYPHGGDGRMQQQLMLGLLASLGGSTEGCVSIRWKTDFVFNCLLRLGYKRRNVTAYRAARDRLTPASALVQNRGAAACGENIGNFPQGHFGPGNSCQHQ